MRGHRELRVWHSAMELVVAIYGLTRGFPKHEQYAFSSQLQRAAVSVPANIAEGNARQHRREYLHFISIARGSLAEVDTYLELVPHLEYASADQIRPLLEQTAALGRQLTALRNTLAQQPD